MTTVQLYPSGETVQIDPYSYHNIAKAKPGLGHFAFRKVEPRDDGPGYYVWYYKPPNRPWTPLSYEFCHRTTPPPLPRPREEWRKCGCHEKEHTCGACGKPYWVEIHGVADGYCTYCYYTG